jgi:hypothetical protein
MSESTAISRDLHHFHGHDPTGVLDWIELGGLLLEDMKSRHQTARAWVRRGFYLFWSLKFSIANAGTVARIRIAPA